ncbi:hypothetical protein C9J03_12270 [Photobacterium gaetbulicola]|uniref:Chlorhexidine efflux transporter domain-containing protein n=1 Tax=Photobacterium gaetbulicola Gung47 TaxID=658445 RepID=A0A0C5WNQ2_9GAMM|nr:PACE efflux transporter [Photobacterium gaetbulicola]AJR08723.1 hypothetical protein H744_2c2059 [Photobacterium gaetbulicola Gung47]PSU10356.1 hypothetical protein C9J03_12270 [Photobacterium gaetbulicola]
MTIKERILHTVLFEVFALMVLMGAATIFTRHNPAVVGGLSVVMSLIAMAWNYLYNVLFDKFAGEERLNRTIKMRMLHGLGFEGGLIFVTIPVLMWILQLDFWTVFILDLGIVIFFLLYAIIYNWLYDHAKAKFFTKPLPIKASMS